MQVSILIVIHCVEEWMNLMCNIPTFLLLRSWRFKQSTSFILERYRYKRPLLIHGINMWAVQLHREGWCVVSLLYLLLPLIQGGLGGRGSDQSGQTSWVKNSRRWMARFFCWQAPPSNPAANIRTRRAKYVFHLVWGAPVMSSRGVISIDMWFGLFYTQVRQVGCPIFNLQLSTNRQLLHQTWSRHYRSQNMIRYRAEWFTRLVK